MVRKISKPVSKKGNVLTFPSFANIVVGLISCIFGLFTPPLLHRLIIDEEYEFVYQIFNMYQPKSVDKSPIQNKATQSFDSNISTQGEKGDQQQKQERRALQSKTLVKNSCTDDILMNFLHDNPVRGYHVICFSALYTSKRHDGGRPYSLELVNVTFYKDGVVNPTASSISILEKESTEGSSSTSWDALKKTFVTNLELSSWDSLHQPWSVFATNGKRIIGETDVETNTKKDTKNSVLTELLKYGVVLLYQGGQFIWPGIRIGFERPLTMDDSFSDNNKLGSEAKNVTLVTLSLNPLVLSVQGFLSSDECDYIQAKATPTMQYSGVVLMDRDAGRPASDFRTSQTTFLSAHADSLLTNLDYRTAKLVRIPRNHQEPLQVLRYDLSERYLSHTDYFPPEHYQNDKNTMNLIQNGLKNRMITVFWYLSTVEEGGETVFPRFNGRREVSSADCSGGLLVKPEKGKVIIFYSLTTSGEVDDQSLHGACPVKKGLKWAANKWIWNHPMSYVAT